MENNTGADFNPLQESVIQRDYTRPKVTLNDVTPIDEPTFTSPSFEELDKNYQQQLGAEQPAAEEDTRKVWGADAPAGSGNPYQEPLDKKEQKLASQAMVDAILDGYSGLKHFSNKLIALDKNKIEKLIRNGEISGNIMIPVDGGQVPLMQYVEMYNEETKNTIHVSDDFKEKVAPVLLRVLMKRNIGMTDEQLLAYYFGTDIVVSGFQIMQLRNQNNAILSQLKEMNATQGAAKQTTQPPVQNKQEVQSEPVTKEPITDNREFVEPEEVIQSKQSTPTYTDVDILEDLQPEIKTPSSNPMVATNAMPEFGDASIIAEMNKIAGTGKPTRKTTKKGK